MKQAGLKIDQMLPIHSYSCSGLFIHSSLKTCNTITSIVVLGLLSMARTTYKFQGLFSLNMKSLGTRTHEVMSMHLGAVN